jgi:hypothetical protein
METALSALLWIVTIVAGVWAFIFLAIVILVIGGILYAVYHD